MTGLRNPERYDRWCRATDGPLLLAPVAFLLVLLLPLYKPDLPAATRSGLSVANLVVWTVFAVDYLARLALAPNRRWYVRTHVTDLLTIAVPFLRPLRLLRVVGLLGQASRRAGERQLVAVTTYVIGGVTLLIVVAAGLVLDAERGVRDANITDAGDALWWAATTVSTVGYGDKFPTTGSGRMAAVALMVGGIALLGVVTATFAAWFVRRFSAVEVLETAVHTDTLALADVLADLGERLARIELLLDARTDRV